MSKKNTKGRGWTKRVLGHEFLESRSMLSGSPWQNPMSCNDLNDDGTVSPADALLAINSLNSGVSGQLSGKLVAPTASGSTSSYVDANGDGYLSPADPLLVINALNSGTDSDETDTDDLPTEDQQPDKIGADVPALTLTNGFARVNAELNADGDVDVFQVTATAATLNVALFTRVSGDMTVSIVNANGDVLATASTADATAHHPAATSATVEAGTSYFVVVSGGSGVTGEYCLQVINSDSTLTPPPPGHGADGGDTDDSGDTDGDSDNTDHPAPLTPTELFTKLDANADGSLSLDEFSTLPAPKDAQATAADVFAKLDTDTSGSLSLDEFAVLFTKPAGGDDHGGPEHGSPEQGGPQPGGGPNGGGPGGGRQGGPPVAPPSPSALFTKLDADADGSLTETEFATFVSPSSKVPADEIFAAWDTDTSGMLSLTEFSAGLATLKKH
ncbi:MAG: EF-hand domain-containing protein [Myxococcales bacterium]